MSERIIADARKELRQRIAFARRIHTDAKQCGCSTDYWEGAYNALRRFRNRFNKICRKE